MNRLEFENSLQNVMQSWENKRKEEVDGMAGEVCGNMVGFEQQNPHHCYTLFEHILHTVDMLPEGSPITLKIAAFFHDIGKPEVAFIKEGRKVFYGHARRSAEIADQWLKEHGYLEAECKEICFLIKHHDDFIPFEFWEMMQSEKNYFLKEINPKNVFEYVQKTQSDADFPQNMEAESIWSHLFELCRADVNAQSEYVYQNGRLIDSRQHKLDKINAVESIYVNDELVRTLK